MSTKENVKTSALYKKSLERKEARKENWRVQQLVSSRLILSCATTHTAAEPVVAAAAAVETAEFGETAAVAELVVGAAAAT
eukprot:3087252-Amphidinium_carterae.1